MVLIAGWRTLRTWFFLMFLSFVKDLKSLFFSIPVFGYGSVGLLMACVIEGLTTFVTPFYL
jgi:hypothetical protein